MWMREAEEEVTPPPMTASMAALLTVSTGAVFYLGLAPGRLIAVVRDLFPSVL